MPRSDDVDDDLPKGALGQLLVRTVGVFKGENAVNDGVDGVLVEEANELVERAQMAHGDPLDVRLVPNDVHQVDVGCLAFQETDAALTDLASEQHFCSLATPRVIHDSSQHGRTVRRDAELSLLVGKSCEGRSVG